MKNYINNKKNETIIMQLLKMFIILFLLLLTNNRNNLRAESWELFYQNEDYVTTTNMKYSSFPTSENGLIFSLLGVNGGVGFFNNENDSLEIYNVTGFSGANTICPDENNNRILCGFGVTGSYSDGIYSFDMDSKTFELNEYIDIPVFIKKVSTGFYVGSSVYNEGLYYSQDGDNWDNVDFFDDKNVVDIEETSDGDIFIAAGNEIYLKNGDEYNSTSYSYLSITDIYITNQENRVFVSCGLGSNSDCVYEVIST